MKKQILFLPIMLFIAYSSISVSESNQDQTSDLSSAEKGIRSHINLLNEIIRNPQAANMKNWITLANPHDETELIFFMNSISDGTINSYKPESPSGRKLVEHSRSKSDRSVVLQYLRLSLMAFSRRPDVVPPQFKIENVSISKNGKDDRWICIAKGRFAANDASGRLIEYPVKITFASDIGEHSKSPNAVNSVFNKFSLETIIVNGHEIYGWWYRLALTKN